MIDGRHERHADTGGASPLPRSAAHWLIATIAACIACALLLAVKRAGWLDEYWTVWHTDPANPLVAAYRTRWIYDTPHPPTFYALTWALAPLTGPTLVVRRLVVNGLAVLLAAGAFVACRRAGNRDAQPLLFALLIASNPFFLTYFAEHRSYFLAVAASACLTATVRQLHRETAAGAPLRPVLALWLAVNTLVALNLHYMVSMCMLALLGWECLWQWFRGDRRRAALVALVATVAVLPALVALAAATAVQKPMPVTHESFVTAWTTIGFMAVVGVLVNLVLAWHALPAAAALAREQRWFDRADDADGGKSFILVLIASIVLLIPAFVVVHAINRNLYPRLVLGMIPLASAALAELAARRPLARLVTSLVCANAALIVAVTTVHGLRNGRWEYYAPAIAATVRACPTTRVLAYDTLYLLPPDNPGWKAKGQMQSMALAYHMIARKYGFTVQVMPVEGPPAPAGGACPTLVWMEHNFFRQDVDAADLARRAGVGAAAERMSLLHDDSHYLLRIDPAALRTGG